MFKLYIAFIIFINLINIEHCLGITNYTKINDYYIIDIASEDIKYFQERLYNIIINIKNEFNLIILKVLLSTIGPFLLFMAFRVSKRKKISIKLCLIYFIIISICDIYYIFHEWNIYKFGIISAGNAISSLEIAMNDKYSIDPRKSNFKNHIYKVNYLGDEIEKYGIHAMFCEIPGTLPSNNANKLSFSSGLDCFNYDSQRKFLDQNSYNYVGDDLSKDYRKIQINKNLNFFN